MKKEPPECYQLGISCLFDYAAGTERCDWCEWKDDCANGIDPCEYCDFYSSCRGVEEE